MVKEGIIKPGLTPPETGSPGLQNKSAGVDDAELEKAWSPSRLSDSIFEALTASPEVEARAVAEINKYTRAVIKG